MENWSDIGEPDTAGEYVGGAAVTGWLEGPITWITALCESTMKHERWMGGSGGQRSQNSNTGSMSYHTRTQCMGQHTYRWYDGDDVTNECVDWMAWNRIWKIWGGLFCTQTHTKQTSQQKTIALHATSSRVLRKWNLRIGKYGDLTAKKRVQATEINKWSLSQHNGH